LKKKGVLVRLLKPVSQLVVAPLVVAPLVVAPLVVAAVEIKKRVFELVEVELKVLAENITVLLNAREWVFETKSNLPVLRELLELALFPFVVVDLVFQMSIPILFPLSLLSPLFPLSPPFPLFPLSPPFPLFPLSPLFPIPLL
jgi:hypothetical protein